MVNPFIMVLYCSTRKEKNENDERCQQQASGSDGQTDRCILALVRLAYITHALLAPEYLILVSTSTRYVQYSTVQ